MTSLLKGAVRGLGAGAAGTTALNVTTYADMAVRGRAASDTPQSTVSALADRIGTPVPGRGSTRANRLQGLGAITGMSSGLVVGGIAGVLRAAGVRLPTPIGGPLLGAAAMAATDLPMARLGVSDPRRRSRADWTADAVPHLIYGLTTHATLVSAARADEDAARRNRERYPRTTPVPRPPRASDVLRAAAVGAASGARSSVGLFALALRSKPTDEGLAGRLARPGSRGLHGVLAATEFGWDKHPSIPDRVSGQGLGPRVTLGATSAGAAARRNGVEGGVPSLVGAAAAVGTGLAGYRARTAARRRFGSDLPGAVIEDVLAAALAWAGTGRSAAARR